MADRYTQKDAKEAFNRLASALGKGVRPFTSEGRGIVGAWYLDSAPVYGGYVINEIVNEAAGVSQPFGAARHSARDFCAMVNFALAAIGVRDENDNPFSAEHAASL